MGREGAAYQLMLGGMETRESGMRVHVFEIRMAKLRQSNWLGLSTFKGKVTLLQLQAALIVFIGWICLR